LKQMLLCLILLMPLNASGNELLDILTELQIASSEIRQGFNEVKAGLTESKAALDDSMVQLDALRNTLNQQKDDLADAKKELSNLRTAMVIGGIVLGGGLVVVTVVAIVK